MQDLDFRNSYPKEENILEKLEKISATKIIITGGTVVVLEKFVENIGVLPKGANILHFVKSLTNPSVPMFNQGNIGGARFGGFMASTLLKFVIPLSAVAIWKTIKGMKDIKTRNEKIMYIAKEGFYWSLAIGGILYLLKICNQVIMGMFI